MNGKSGGCRGGEEGVMNYSAKVEDARTGCQLTNQAEREGKKEGGNRAAVRAEKDGKGKSFGEDKTETKLSPEQKLIPHEQQKLI